MKQYAYYVKVHGKVQGVGFRYSAVREAQRLKINGWVMNASDGDVEVCAEGQKEKLDIFLKWLERGPQFSRVDSIEKNEMPPKGWEGFNIKY